MMKKWFEKGKQYLDNRNQPKSEQQQSNNDIQKPNSTKNVNINNKPYSTTKKIIPAEKRKELMKKTIDHEKLYIFSDKLQGLKQTDKSQQFQELKTSLFYKEIKQDNITVQPQLQQFYEQNKKDFDFLSPQFQQMLNSQQIQQEELKIFQNNPIFLINIVNFHHKKGPMVEFYYPSNFGEQLEGKEEKIFEDLTYYALPDAIHNKNEDCVYFILEQTNIFKQKFLLYGVSFFKQIEVSQQMKDNDSSLTRNYMQKSLCVLSIYPFFGYLLSRIEPTIKAYFQQENLNDFSILINTYESLNSNFAESSQNIEESELFVGISPRTLLYLFKDKIFQLLKCLLLEKRVVVYSLHSQACSNFIISLLSLLPGELHFRFTSKQVNSHELSYRDFGFPFRIFSEKSPLIPYCTIQNLDSLKHTKAFLLGTTNLLIKTHKTTNPDVIIDLDKKQIEFVNLNLQKQIKLNSHEKKFMDNLVKNIYLTIGTDEKTCKISSQISAQKWENSSDYLRNCFYDYFQEMVIEIVFYRQNLEQVSNDYLQVLQKNSNLFNEEDEEESKPTQVFDGETIMIMGVNPKETRKGKFITQMKQILHQNFKQLKKYNLKFMNNWVETDNFQFWLNNHDMFTLSYKSFSNCNQMKSDHIFTFDGGDLYLGCLYQGLKHGKGVFYDATHHRTFHTQFNKNQKNGHTKIQSMSRDYYFEGKYLNDVKDGQGFLKTPQFEYQGNFENSKQHGFGTLETNEYKYEGEFQDGKKSGMGKLSMKNQFQYVGFFYQDLFENNGQLVMNNGDIYNGTFKEGKKSGMGEFQTDQVTYKGEFKEDLFNGQGIMIRKQEKQEIQGFFENGNLTQEEQCIIKYENGNVYSGIVKNFLPNGKGILSKFDGTIINAIFLNGEILQEIFDEQEEYSEKDYAVELVDLDNQI